MHFVILFQGNECYFILLQIWVNPEVFQSWWKKINQDSSFLRNATTRKFNFVPPNDVKGINQKNRVNVVFSVCTILGSTVVCFFQYSHTANDKTGLSNIKSNYFCCYSHKHSHKKLDSLETLAVKLRFILIYENMLKSTPTTRSECTAKQKNRAS